MSALRLIRPGRPPVLELARRPTPEPQPGEALLRMDACGFCHHDLLVLSGVLRRGVAAGVTLGHEIAGTVVSVGDGVATDWIGARVVSLLTAACGQCARCRAGQEHRCPAGAGIGHGRDGGFAEYVALPVSALVPIPEGLPATSAALLACPAGVALRAVATAGVAAGELVVVTGAGGGLGVHAVQLAAARGAQVVAVTSSAERAARLESLGAMLAIDASDLPDFSDMVLALSDDAGADVVIDTVGPPRWPQTLRCLGQFGRLALLGDVTGEPVPLRIAEVIFRDAQLLGVSGVSRAELRETVALAAAGRLQPVVAATLPLTPAGVAEACRRVADRQVFGRIVFTPPPAAGPA